MPAMIRPLTGLAVVLLCLAPVARADIEGCWISEAGTSVIEMRTSGDRVTGRVVGLQEPMFLAEEDLGTPGAVRIDLNNPEPELRDRPIAGMAIVRDLAPDGDEWKGGSIYDPQSGKTYSAKAEVDGDGTLRLRGYIGSPMFGRTTRWDPAARRPVDAERMLARADPFLPAQAPPPDC